MSSLPHLQPDFPSATQSHFPVSASTQSNSSWRIQRSQPVTIPMYKMATPRIFANRQMSVPKSHKEMDSERQSGSLQRTPQSQGRISNIPKQRIKVQNPIAFDDLMKRPALIFDKRKHRRSVGVERPRPSLSPLKLADSTETSLALSFVQSTDGSYVRGVGRRSGCSNAGSSRFGSELSPDQSVNNKRLVKSPKLWRGLSWMNLQNEKEDRYFPNHFRSHRKPPPAAKPVVDLHIDAQSMHNNANTEHRTASLSRCDNTTVRKDKRWRKTNGNKSIERKLADQVRNILKPGLESSYLP